MTMIPPEISTEEITQLAALFDKCLTTENPEIKSAFRELMVLVALTEDPEREVSVLTGMLKEITLLRTEVQIMRTLITPVGQTDDLAYKTAIQSMATYSGMPFNKNTLK